MGVFILGFCNALAFVIGWIVLTAIGVGTILFFAALAWDYLRYRRQRRLYGTRDDQAVKKGD